jgi:hypothetical protein
MCGRSRIVVGEHGAQLRHRYAIGRTEVDPAQQRDKRRHQRRLLAARR